MIENMEEFLEEIRESYESGDDRTEEWFSFVEESLEESVPALLDKGRTDEAFDLVCYGWTALDTDHMDWWDDDWVFLPSYVWWKRVIDRVPVTDLKMRDGMFRWFIDELDGMSLPEYAHASVTATVFQCFPEERFLLELIKRTDNRMRTTQMEDIRDHSAGVLCDLYDRLGGHEAEIADLTAKYGKETGFLIARCDLWRMRGDDRCLPVLEELRDNESFATAFRKSRAEEIESFLRNHA